MSGINESARGMEGAALSQTKVLADAIVLCMSHLPLPEPAGRHHI